MMSLNEETIDTHMYVLTFPPLFAGVSVLGLPTGEVATASTGREEVSARSACCLSLLP